MTILETAERLSATAELAGGLLVVVASAAVLLTLRSYAAWWKWEGRPAWDRLKARWDALPRYRLRIERR